MIIDWPSRLVGLVAMAMVLSQAYVAAPEPSKGRAPRAGTVELILGMAQVPRKCISFGLGGWGKADNSANHQARPRRRAADLIVRLRKVTMRTIANGSRMRDADRPPKCPRENLLPTDILPTIILAC